MDHLLWNATHGFYRSYTGADAIMADSLYAQVLADSLGLGALTTDDQVRSHLKMVLRENDTPYGLLCQTGRYDYPGPSAIGHDADNSVWLMANPNWGTLSLWRGGDVEEALAVVEKTYGWWRSSLNDLWNVVALHGGVGYGAEGMPLANSHYGYHMVGWHLLFALSGQQYSRPDQTLTFRPRAGSEPFRLPVMVPNTAGVISRTAGLRSAYGRALGDTYVLEVVAGEPLKLQALSVNGVAPPAGALPCTLASGQRIVWSAEP